MSKGIHEAITSQCNKLDMPFYQTILLIEMVYRKLEHPNEGIKELIDGVKADTVPKQYERLGKPNCMQIAAERERDRLGEELHKSSNLPEELVRGDIVVNVVNYYYAKFRELYDN